MQLSENGFLTSLTSLVWVKTLFCRPAAGMINSRYVPKHNKKDGYRQLNVRQLDSLRPWDHRGKCYMDRKRIQCLSNASQHVPIYLQPFLRYSGISVASEWFSTVLVSEWAFFNYILLSPGYTPGTITANVTWIEREFNSMLVKRIAACTHLSSTVYEL